MRNIILQNPNKVASLAPVAILALRNTTGISALLFSGFVIRIFFKIGQIIILIIINIIVVFEITIFTILIKNSVSLFCLLSSLATILLVYNYRRMKVVLIMEKIMSMIIMDNIMI